MAGVTLDGITVPVGLAAIATGVVEVVDPWERVPAPEARQEIQDLDALAREQQRRWYQQHPTDAGQG
jgi:hypothetical protein